MSFSESEIWEHGFGPSGHPDEGLYVQAIVKEAAMQESIVIECDTIIHDDFHRFCDDWTCPCHEDRDAVNAITDYVDAGLMTTIEANLIMRGATI